MRHIRRCFTAIPIVEDIYLKGIAVDYINARTDLSPVEVLGEENHASIVHFTAPTVHSYRTLQLKPERKTGCIREVQRVAVGYLDDLGIVETAETSALPRLSFCKVRPFDSSVVVVSTQIVGITIKRIICDKPIGYIWGI